MVVHQRAHGVTDTDSDELILVEVRQDWWVARRLDERVVVWAYPDRDHAEVGFDEQPRDTQGRGEWVKSRPTRRSA